MTKIIPQEVLEIYKKLENVNYEVYLVGGSVRDLLLKRDIKDWDLTTNAKPEEILKIFSDGFYNNEFGTVGVPLTINDVSHVIEITTFRTEKSSVPTHKPDQVTWGETIEEDLQRRDFTINAIALRLASLAQGKLSDSLLVKGKSPVFEMIDPFKGEKDLKNKIIKAVGDPNLRFKEDALRLLRAVRIATELEFKIEKETFAKIKTDAKLLEHISKERVQTELLRILRNEHAYEGVMLLFNSGLLEYILPELLEGINFSQVRPGRHHTDDVFTHNLLALKFCPSSNPIVRFAALLHDVGKPKSATKDKDGLVIFHNHEVTGARIAEKICDRLKFSKENKDRVVNLIRWHMFGVNENQTDASIRRFIRKVGIENIQDMMDIRVADRLGSGRPRDSWRLKLFNEKIEEQLKPAKFSINDLAIDGNDIMKELQIKPSPKVGEILQKLFEETDEDLSKNNKEYLLSRLKELA